MNTYLIRHKVKAIANLGFEFQYGGYVFTPFEADKGFGSEEWLATKEVQSSDYHQASIQFRQGLTPVLDALSVLTQCSFTLIAMSYFIFRLNDNPDSVFYLYVARDRRAVGMPFWEKEQLEDLERILKIDNKVALHYLRESNNSSTAKTRLAMLVIAAEALAGQSKKTRTCPDCGRQETFGATDRAQLEQIVGKETYDRLYVKDHGSLRHRLFHGNIIADQDVVEVVLAVYENVLAFLTTNLGLTTVQKIVAAPRSFTSFEYGGLFLRGKPEIPDLKLAEENWNKPSLLTPVEEPKGY